MAKTLFLIEDDKALIETISEFLRSKGYIIETSYNGEEALKMLPVVRPDLILLDLILPEMNGIDFLKKIQLDNTEFANIPVLVLTNLQGDEETFQKLGLKIDGYFIKANTSLEELSKKIKAGLFKKVEIKVRGSFFKHRVFNF